LIEYQQPKAYYSARVGRGPSLRDDCEEEKRLKAASPAAVERGTVRDA